MIGIIGAMSTEVDSLIQKINNPKLQKIGCFSFVAGTIYNKEVVVLKSRDVIKESDVTACPIL